jgi:hypothetical protein
MDANMRFLVCEVGQSKSSGALDAGAIARLYLSRVFSWPNNPQAEALISRKDCHPGRQPFHAPCQAKMAGKPYLTRGFENRSG